jgi:NAD(P)-dependent dehydrogenase (short-subunit alcohol dehydrogenase family)
MTGKTEKVAIITGGSQGIGAGYFATAAGLPGVQVPARSC